MDAQTTREEKLRELATTLLRMKDTGIHFLFSAQLVSSVLEGKFANGNASPLLDDNEIEILENMLEANSAVVTHLKNDLSTAIALQYEIKRMKN